MTIQTTVTFNPKNAKESLEATIQALQSAVDASAAGCDWHERTRKALSAPSGSPRRLRRKPPRGRCVKDGTSPTTQPRWN